MSPASQPGTIANIKIRPAVQETSQWPIHLCSQHLKMFLWRNISLCISSFRVFLGCKFKRITRSVFINNRTQCFSHIPEVMSLWVQRFLLDLFVHWWFKVTEEGILWQKKRTFTSQECIWSHFERVYLCYTFFATPFSWGGRHESGLPLARSDEDAPVPSLLIPLSCRRCWSSEGPLGPGKSWTHRQHAPDRHGTACHRQHYLLCFHTCRLLS